MRYRQLNSAIGIVVSMCVTCACSRSRAESVSNTTTRTPAAVRLQLRCEPQSELLQCEALASDDPTNVSD